MPKKVFPYLPFMLVMFLAVVSLADPALAQSGDLQGLQLSVFGGDFWEAAGRLFNFFLLIAGIIAFLFVLYGGFLYLTAGGDATRTENGRKFITNALIGIIIIFISYALVRFLIGRTRTGDELDLSYQQEIYTEHLAG